MRTTLFIKECLRENKMPRFQDEKHIPKRCKTNDPHRCATGDCEFLAVPGDTHCILHNRSQDLDTTKKGIYNFNMTEVALRIKQFKNHPDSKKLTEELGLLRLLLEQAVNKCECAYDLVTQSTQLTALVEKIRIVQQANINIEQKLGDLLSMEQVTEIAQALYDVVTLHIKKQLPEDVALDTLEDIAKDFEITLEKKF